MAGRDGGVPCRRRTLTRSRRDYGPDACAARSRERSVIRLGTVRTRVWQVIRLPDRRRVAPSRGGSAAAAPVDVLPLPAKGAEKSGHSAARSSLKGVVRLVRAPLCPHRDVARSRVPPVVTASSRGPLFEGNPSRSASFRD